MNRLSGSQFPSVLQSQQLQNKIHLRVLCFHGPISATVLQWVHCSCWLWSSSHTSKMGMLEMPTLFRPVLDSNNEILFNACSERNHGLVALRWDLLVIQMIYPWWGSHGHARLNKILYWWSESSELCFFFLTIKHMDLLASYLKEEKSFQLRLPSWSCHHYYFLLGSPLPHHPCGVPGHMNSMGLIEMVNPMYRVQALHSVDFVLNFFGDELPML